MTGVTLTDEDWVWNGHDEVMVTTERTYDSVREALELAA